MKQIIETIMVMTYCIGLFVLTAHAQKANSLDISNRHLQENTVLQNSNEVQTPDIIGTWCNNSLYEETGEFFQLEITQDNNKTIAMYNNGGPFEIQFHVKSNKENIQLFFDQISGTTSFANAFGNKQFTKEHPMVVVNILNNETIELEVLYTKRPYFAEKGKYTLKKLPKDDTCFP